MADRPAQLEEDVAVFLGHWEDSPALPSEASPILIALVQGVKSVEDALGDLRKIAVYSD
jgi:hypothetical protein